jgi:putative transcriptional regulator
MGRTTVIWVPKQVDVKRIRRKFGLTQAEFAQRFGFSLSAVRDWEQRRRTPQGPARALLTVIEKEPEAVLRALAG